MRPLRRQIRDLYVYLEHLTDRQLRGRRSTTRCTRTDTASREATRRGASVGQILRIGFYFDCLLIWCFCLRPRLVPLLLSRAIHWRACQRPDVGGTRPHLPPQPARAGGHTMFIDSLPPQASLLAQYTSFSAAASHTRCAEAIVQWGRRQRAERPFVAVEVALGSPPLSLHTTNARERASCGLGGLGRKVGRSALGRAMAATKTLANIRPSPTRRRASHNCPQMVPATPANRRRCGHAGVRAGARRDDSGQPIPRREARPLTLAGGAPTPLSWAAVRAARGGCGPAVRRFKRSGASMRRPSWPGDLVGQVGGARVTPAAARRPPVLVRPPRVRDRPRPHARGAHANPPRAPHPAPRPLGPPRPHARLPSGTSISVARRFRAPRCFTLHAAWAVAPPCTPRGRSLALASSGPAVGRLLTAAVPRADNSCRR